MGMLGVDMDKVNECAYVAERCHEAREVGARR